MLDSEYDLYRTVDPFCSLPVKKIKKEWMNCKVSINKLITFLIFYGFSTLSIFFIDWNQQKR